MSDAVLYAFRDIADQMNGGEPQDWQWIGKYVSQRMFGISEARAKEYAQRHGGVASKMEPVKLPSESRQRKVVHKRVCNGATVCKPFAEGDQADRMLTTYSDSEVTCKRCRKACR